MKIEEYEEISQKLKEYIITTMVASKAYGQELDKQSIETIMQLFKMDLLHRESRARQNIEELKSDNNEIRQKYLADLNEITSMRNIYEFSSKNTEKIIRDCLAEFAKRDQENDKDKIHEGKNEDVGLERETRYIRHLISHNLEQMNKPTEKVIEQLRKEKAGEMKEIFYTPKEDEEQR